MQKQINDQVWKPFVRAFNDRDDKAFRFVHSPDLIRVSQDQKKISGLDEYLPELTAKTTGHKSNGTRKIELRFIQRIASNGRAFEVGYYKTTVSNSAGHTNSFYGKFHVLLRKEKGIWKILMDADAHENVNETVFSAASPIE